MTYILEKYKGQTTRFTCPKCGRRHSFTRYINKETGEYISPLVGICNRAIKCGYHFPPKQFFENSSSFNSMDKMDKIDHTIIPIKQINKIYLKKTFGKESNFLTFLKNTFPEDVVEQVILDYFLSGTKDKSVIYWQIDKEGRIRTGKIMQYNPETGRRIKSEKSSISWVHSNLKRKGILPMDWELTQCLFGEHLIKKYPQKPIMLVESEKTAIIMTCYHPCFNWLATGGLQNLKAEKIYPIRKNNIMAYPDLKCYELWKDKAEKINNEIGSNILVSHYLEEVATPEQKELGLDIADFYLMMNG